MGTALQAKAMPQGCTHLQLRQLMRRVARLYDAELAQAGLKTTQFSLLTALDKLGPAQPGQLARTLRLQPSTLTRNLQPLVAAGWVEQGPGSDGRSRLVALTEAGRAKRAEARQRWKKAQLELNRLLGDARVAALHALLQESLALLAPEPLEAAEDVA
ncbi:MarR family winged helix-turn-helix transcriptional regulator [Pseudorhodoferax sp. Leaf265]|jgi:DNA-binding MarR family transcriptional regulator|uniref:MarR family winged helix-turn-helix transcriptional regulator n=1 Tax=Pseudorhodoferax sp. Leaf265 TaxID=1736315 RepID=UPI0006FCB6F8|nr:MarR family winged helix-turn-helix transcriptional regulator [Pseudorhodoferax sp. Leaf265]KQP19098.1 MarR family transcriptional regulator [Pseudorhodoferax sp. Leaf265]